MKEGIINVHHYGCCETKIKELERKLEIARKALLYAGTKERNPNIYTCIDLAMRVLAEIGEQESGE